MNVRLAIPLVCGICLAAQGVAQPRVWTHAGSAGTVDETFLSVVRLVQGEATLAPGAPNSTRAVIRYNIVAVDALFARLRRLRGQHSAFGTATMVQRRRCWLL